MRSGLRQDRLCRRDQVEGIEVERQDTERTVLHQQEHHSGHRRRHHQRQCHQRPQHPVTFAIGVKQKRDEDAERKLNRKRDEGIDQRGFQRMPHTRIREGARPLVESGEVELPGDDIAFVKRQPNRIGEGIDAENEKHHRDRREPGERMLGRHEPGQGPSGRFAGHGHRAHAQISARSQRRIGLLPIGQIVPT